MKLEDLATLKDTALPLLGAINEIVMKLLNGTNQTREAMKELRYLHVLLGERIKAADSAFAETDAKNDERAK